MSNNIILHLIVEFLAALSATIFFFKIKSSSLKWILPLLWYIPISELLCHTVFRSGGYMLLLNIYEFVVPVSLLLITRDQLKDDFRRKVMSYITASALIVFIINWILIDPLKEFSKFAFTIASILIVIGLLYYLIEQLKSNEILKVNRDIFLWVCFGFLVFHISYPVILFAEIYFTSQSGFGTTIDKLRGLQSIIVTISYLIVAFGFYYGEKRNSKTLKQELS